jgi:hypothetical protein
MSLLNHSILAEYSIVHGLERFAVFGFAGILMTFLHQKQFYNRRWTDGNG